MASPTKTTTELDVSLERFNLNQSAAPASNTFIYPRAYFDINTGKGPQTPEDAMFWWPHRKKRPATADCIDTEPFNGDAMINEVKEVRHRLRQYTEEKYLDCVRELAYKHNVTLADTNGRAIMKMDMRNAIVLLPNNPESHRIVFEVFHEFHRDRSWSSTVIDEWLEINNAILAPRPPEEELEDKRFHTNQRGGFSVVVRQIKSDLVGGFMKKLYRENGWCITTSNSETDGTRKYVPVMGPKPKKRSEKQKVLYYVAIKIPGAIKEKPSRNNKNKKQSMTYLRLTMIN